MALLAEGYVKGTESTDAGHQQINIKLQHEKPGLVLLVYLKSAELNDQVFTVSANTIESGYSLKE